MANFMRPYESQTYALLRIVAGFLFLWHGMQKLFGFPGDDAARRAGLHHLGSPDRSS